MKVWITRYALSRGILAADDGIVSAKSPGMCSVPSLGVFAEFHGEGKDWHRSYSSAVERAERMRVDKINSCQKQIERLGRMEFTP